MILELDAASAAAQGDRLVAGAVLEHDVAVHQLTAEAEHRSEEQGAEEAGLGAVAVADPQESAAEAGRQLDRARAGRARRR